MAARFVSAAEAIDELVPEGTALLAVGGMHLQNNPMALVFELVRRRRRFRRLLTSPSASLNADLLIGAGLTNEVATPYVGFEHLGLAPCFRRAVEQGAVRLLELDEAGVVHGLYAGAGGLPFIPLPERLVSDLYRLDGDLYRQIRDPFGGATHWAVRAIRPDVALIHAAEADERRNAVFRGACFTDRLMALAARRLIVQVERVVPAVIAGQPAGSTIPGFLVDAVVVAPGGCLPTAAQGEYGYDEAALRAYLAAARSPEGFAAHLAELGLVAGEARA